MYILSIGDKMNQYEWNFRKYYGSNQGCYQEIKNIEKRLDDYNIYIYI